MTTMRETRIITCRCPEGDEEPEYWHCSVHDRSSRPRGEPVRGDDAASPETFPTP